MTKQRLTLWIIIGVLAVIAGVKIASHFAAKPIDSVAARTKGGAQARVKIVEFIDFQCPACAYGWKQLGEYMAKHSGQIQVQVKYFPLVRSHSHAMQSALYSECAARQDKFWQFGDVLMPQQPQWSPLLSADGWFQNIAKQVGLDIPQLNACLASEEAAKTISDDRTLGQSLGVQSTPAYFINNKLVVGAKSLMDELNTHFPPEK